MPDETKVVGIEELLDLDNGILFQSLSEQMENNHHNVLSDLAVTATSSTIRDNNDNDEDTDKDDDDDDDDDGSPRNCVLFGKGNCLYRNKNFRQLKETWIGCEFPNCDDWYHESCLRIQLSAIDKDSYTFICNKHSEAKGHF